MSSTKITERAPREVAVYQRRAVVGVSDCIRGSSDESIEYCLRQFGETPVIFNDDGQSGRSPDRIGLRKVMAGIAAGEIKALVVRDVSTLSREIFDLLWIQEQLKLHDVELHAVSSGGLISGPTLFVDDKQAAQPEIQ